MEPTLLTDAQFGAFLAAVVAFGTALIGTARWSVGRITKVIDDASATSRAQAEAFAVMHSKLDDVADFVLNAPPRLARAATGPPAR